MRETTTPVSDTDAVVLVEGLSDRYALEALARRRGRDLDAERVHILAMKGATNIGHFLDRYGPRGLGVRLAGLYDAAEEGCFLRGLERAGLAPRESPVEMEKLGFFRCSADLEDELIHALGTDEVERIIEEEGELRSFRILQRQPAQRGRSTHDQLHRFLGSRAGRKHRYGRLLASAVDLTRVPRSLDCVLAHVAGDQ
jgi:predicted ATP-dependent endonuclease of OLD family